MAAERTKRRKRRRCGRVALGLLVVVVVLNWTWGRLPEAPAAPAGSKYETVAGKRLHYVERPGRGPAVLMIHGLPGTTGDWDRVSAALPGRHTITVSRPGYGYSDEGYVPFDEQVTLLHELAERLGLRAPVIAGHSYGGSIALQYGARYPDDVSGIVAVDPAVDPDGPSAMRKAQAWIVRGSQLPVVEQVMDVTAGDLFRSISARSGGTEAYAPDARDQGWVDRILAITMRDRDLEAWAHETLDAPTALSAVRDGLTQTRAEVWVLQGRDDKLVAAEDVQAAAAKLPRAHLRLLAGGHMQPDIHPDEVAAAITAAAR